MNEPKFTIVIPVYNPGEMLRRTIESVLHQTETSWELFCVDDGSTDASIEIMKAYAAKDPRIRYFPFEGDKTHHPRERKLREARGKYTFLCDHDDCMHPQLLAYAAWALETKGADFVDFGYFVNHAKTMPAFTRIDDFESQAYLFPKNNYKYLKPIGKWCLQMTFWSFVTRTAYVRNAHFTYGMELPPVLEILAQVKHPMLSLAQLYAYSVFEGSMARSALSLRYAKACCRDLRTSCELFDYGRKGRREDWHWVRTTSIARNLKYYLNWCLRSEGTVAPEDYEACARFLANEFAFFRKQGCLSLRDCGLRKYLRFSGFIRKWGGSADGNDKAGGIRLVNFLDVPESLQQETRLWRNSPSVQKYFRIPGITPEMHQGWLASLKRANPRSVAFIIEYDGEPIGVTYFHSIDYDKRFADWGLYLYRTDLRGKGVGSGVLNQILSYAREVLKMKRLYVDIMEGNVPSRSLCIRRGFVETGEKDGDFIRYVCELTEA